MSQADVGQVMDVEGAESSPADPVEVALAIGLPTEINAPSTQDSGEPLIDLMNLTPATLFPDLGGAARQANLDVKSL